MATSILRLAQTKKATRLVDVFGKQFGAQMQLSTVDNGDTVVFCEPCSPIAAGAFVSDAHMKKSGASTLSEARMYSYGLGWDQANELETYTLLDGTDGTVPFIERVAMCSADYPEFVAVFFPSTVIVKSVGRTRMWLASSNHSIDLVISNDESVSTLALLQNQQYVHIQPFEVGEGYWIVNQYFLSTLLKNGVSLRVVGKAVRRIQTRFLPTRGSQHV